MVVELMLVVALVRFRHREGRPAPKPTHGHTLMEIAWTLAPAVILVFVAVPTVRTIFATAGEAPADALKVEVIGHQWWWEFKYLDLGLTTANELHVPSGKPVRIAITSADVIHSFWIPPFGGKRDAIPGHTNYIAFRADSTGDYSGQCAEFCGASHANMRLRVIVDSDSGFGAWAQAQLGPAATPPQRSLAAQGKTVYGRSACIGCHTIQGASGGVIGPNLTHIASRATIASGLRSEEHTSELQSPCNLVCRLLLEKKKHTTSEIVISYAVFCLKKKTEENRSRRVHALVVGSTARRGRRLGIDRHHTDVAGASRTDV